MSESDPSSTHGDAQGLLPALSRIEARLDALCARQDALGQQIAALQSHANHVGHLVDRLHARHRFAGGMHLPLPLSRLRDLVVSPGESFRFLHNLERHCAITSVRLRRTAGLEHWRPHLDHVVYLKGLTRAFAEMMFGSRQVIYRTAPRHAPAAGRPRVLHVIPNVFVGGSTQLVVDLHRHLGHRYEMQVLTSAVPAGGRHEGMVIHHLPQGSPASAFQTITASVNPNLVHVHYWGDVDEPWYRSALEPALTAGIAVIENVNTPVNPLRDEKIARYVFVSEYVRTTFAPGLKRSIVVHPGIDLSRFQPPAAWDRDSLDSLGMVYRLHPDKLDVDALQPMIEVARRRPRTRIIVIGDGELLRPFHARVSAAGVARNFEFTGSIPYASLPQAYARFRTFVAPVARESFGQVTPFAMAMGQAVAGNRIGALAEILGYDDTLGRTQDETAKILLDLLENPARIMALAERNAIRAQQFSVDAMIASYSRIYAAALGKEEDLMPGFPPATVFEEV